MMKLHPKNSLAVLLLLVGIFLFLNTSSFFLVYNGELEQGYFYNKFNFDKEKNFPSIFSSILHFISAILLAVIGFSSLKIKTRQTFWLSFSLIFLFLGLDELLRIHEKIGGWIDVNFETSGIFHYGWVIPYGIALIFLFWTSVKSLFELPKKVMFKFILAGTIFIFGAAGMEMLTGWYIDTYKIASEQANLMLEIFFLYTMEELLEMLGICYFIFALLQVLKQYASPVLQYEPAELKIKQN